MALLSAIIDPEKQHEESIDELLEHLSYIPGYPPDALLRAIEVIKLVRDAPRNCEIASPNYIAKYFQGAFK